MEHLFDSSKKTVRKEFQQKEEYTRPSLHICLVVVFAVVLCVSFCILISNLLVLSTTA